MEKLGKGRNLFEERGFFDSLTIMVKEIERKKIHTLLTLAYNPKIIFSSASVSLFFNFLCSFPREGSYSVFGIVEDLDGECSDE